MRRSGVGVTQISHAEPENATACIEHQFATNVSCNPSNSIRVTSLSNQIGRTDLDYSFVLNGDVAVYGIGQSARVRLH